MKAWMRIISVFSRDSADSDPAWPACSATAVVMRFMTTADKRAALPGVSEGRARQVLAGALVAEGAMDLFGVEELAICPWALREGVILKRIDKGSLDAELEANKGDDN